MTTNNGDQQQPVAEVAAYPPVSQEDPLPFTSILHTYSSISNHSNSNSHHNLHRSPRPRRQRRSNSGLLPKSLSYSIQEGPLFGDTKSFFSDFVFFLKRITYKGNTSIDNSSSDDSDSVMAPPENESTPLQSPSQQFTKSPGSGALRKRVDYHSTANDNNNNNDAAAAAASNDALDVTAFDPHAPDHATSIGETFLHLLKGYIGPGCLSLPWAVSQLGIRNGFIAIFVMAYWSSYNCWTVVKLKRFIEKKNAPPTAPVTSESTRNMNAAAAAVKEDDNISDVLSNDGATSVNSYASSNITYPDVGEWAYGAKFQQYVSSCIATQQLAICTVFFSFLGENLMATLDMLMPMSTNLWITTHIGVMTMCFPFILGLSFIPSLKGLAPVMALGTMVLMVGFFALGYLVVDEWPTRPDEGPSVNRASVPLGLCAILYSYEGICLILPVESAMKEPQHFGKVFAGSMTMVAGILAAVSILCVMSFGPVNNGSVTAFLLEKYGNESEHLRFWIMIANTAVSISVLLTYPLQLFPALEVLGPTMAKKFGCLFNPGGTVLMIDRDDENDLTGFDPLPPLPEHEVASQASIDSFEDHHVYDAENGDGKEGPAVQLTSELLKDASANNATQDEDARSIGMSSVTTNFMPRMTMPGDSIQLRCFLVFLTYMVAVVIPNVQALISLAGALAGSSIALLIPPLLELAYLKALEEKEFMARSPSRRHLYHLRHPWGKHWLEKLKCYGILGLGMIFFFIGTYASIADIVKIYISS